MAEKYLLVVFYILAGGAFGYLLRQALAKIKINSYEKKADDILKKSREEAKEILLKAKDRALSVLEATKKEEEQREQQLTRQEERLVMREERIEREISEAEKQKSLLREKVSKIKEIQKNIEELENESRQKLEKIAKMSAKDAKEKLLKIVQKENKEILISRIKKLENTAQQEIEKKAAELIAIAMQRIAASQAEETTTSTITLKDEELKGRIIGKEGRNIRTFQKATGVELIIDDTPETVVISSFSPLRRQVAKVALERLILDGRIQPARIEETVTKVKEEFADKIKQLGEEAVYELGITDFNPKLIHLLGMLYFRTSFGQNLLRHSIEVAHLSVILAEELNANVSICKKAALLHDIGKAVTHEVEGSHVEIGKRIMEKFDVDKEVLEAALAHHEDYPFTSLESRIIQATDAISASRPGVRRENYEAYIKRLEELEALSNKFEGVQKSYAIQAGREIRIFIDAEKIDDIEAYELAKKIAQQIEKDLTYPGEIKVNVIRETRAIEYAR